MTDIKHVLIGCGDVGRRIAAQLIKNGEQAAAILGLVKSQDSALKCQELAINVEKFDVDQSDFVLPKGKQHNYYYLVPPQKTGELDLRSRAILAAFDQAQIRPSKVVLISTTGVYGDCDGNWVTELSETNPQTDRGKRRLDSETQWTDWCKTQNIDYVILRVPGIYARSRIPRQRIEQRIPVVNASECGFTNRVHADDLAAVAIAAMQSAISAEIYNATDGTPGKITDYLNAAAQELNLPIPPQISMQEAEQSLSAGMLSYLSESRKISNQKMLTELKITLRYPNFREGLKFG